MHTVSVKEELAATENFKGSPSSASSDQQKVAIRRAISDISHHIDKHWNIDNNIDDSCEDEEMIMCIVKCECCGLDEDCTQTYITRIRETYSGKWVCGLCSEVMKETSVRAPGRTMDQSMSSHRAICQEFNSTILNPKLSLTSAMKNLAKRVSENRVKTVPQQPLPRLGRASSCVPRIDLNSL